jgi:hypothetical protein
MVDYTKFKLRDVPDFFFLEGLLERYLEELTNENKPTKILKCNVCGKVYYNEDDAYERDFCNQKHRGAYNFRVVKITPKKTSEIKPPRCAG